MNKETQKRVEQAEMNLDNLVPLYSEQRSESIRIILKREGIKSVLDVGCGTGKVDIHLVKHGFNVTGIDVSSKLIHIAWKKAKEFDSDADFKLIRLQALQTKKFDCVLFAGVLEHLINDEEMMFEARRFLKPNGKIVIEVPCHDFLYNKRDRNIGHVIRYSKRILRRRLKNQGYKNIKIFYYNFLVLLGTFYLKVRGLEEFPYRKDNRFIDKMLQLWYKYLENRFIFHQGDKIFAVARK